MTTWTTIIVPETPSAEYVLVKNISNKSTEKTVKEFFLFCGKIQELELISDDNSETQVALIHFEKESAAKTATLLSNALIDDNHITATYYFDNIDSSSQEEEHEETIAAQEAKAKTRIIAEILANGYIIQDQVVAKGLEYDSKYSISTRLVDYFNKLTLNVKQIDEKYRIWDKAVEMDSKFKIQEKVHNVAHTAQETATAALHSPTGQKVERMATQTFAQIAAVHYEAKKIQGEKIASMPAVPVA